MTKIQDVFTICASLKSSLIINVFTGLLSGIEDLQYLDSFCLYDLALNKGNAGIQTLDF